MPDGLQGDVGNPVYRQSKIEVLTLLELKARHPNEAPGPVKQTASA
jgi:hypothetical protein